MWLRVVGVALRLSLVAGGWLLAVGTVQAQPAAGEIELAPAGDDDPISISADEANEWKEGSYDVLLLRGHCMVGQGSNICRANDAVIWILKGDGTDRKPNKAIVYLEGNVQIDAGRRPSSRQAALGPSNDRGWLGRFRSTAPVRINTPRPQREPTVKPAFYQNALDHREPSNAITRTQYVPSNRSAPPPAAYTPPPPGATQQANQPQTATGGLRRLQIFPRGDSPPHIVWERNGQTEEGVAVITGGVQMFIKGPEGDLDIVADKVVLWTVGEVSAQVRDKYQDETVPLEVYLEGNVVFRQGDRVLYSERMYYDVKYKNGTVLQAEITTPAPKYGGLLRLKADMVRQIDDDNFYAQHSYLTSSRLGAPRYRVQSQEVRLYDRQRAQVNPQTGSQIIDPITQEQVIDHDQLLTAKNNAFFIGPVPVFYWPRFTTTLEQPSTLLQSMYFQHDKIFGYWFEARLNAFQLFGLQNPPKGVNWTLTASELTQRGFGAGTNLLVNRQDLFGIQGPVMGSVQAWGLEDRGLDQLGRTRMNDPHAHVMRGRILSQFRQQISLEPNEPLDERLQISTELGLISDYNFLEQYYEAEFEQHKDETTDIEVKKITENREWTIYTQARVNPFFTQTNWLPRLDHYAMGQSLLGDRLTWFEHSDVGYAQFKVIQPPTFSAEEMANFNYLPWESAGSKQGDRVVSRHEIDAPMQLGPVKVVPYALGELAQWGQNLNGQDVGRAFGQVGARSSLLFWAANPNIESELFNVHGLAHKVLFDVDAFASGTNLPFTSLPLYDPIDDDALNRWRRRFMSLDYGATLPAKFDPRFYDFRSGIQSYVASPTAEIAGNLQAVQLGMRHRWQTKRGPLGNRRIIDLAVLNVGATYFPNPNRDNFGANWGLVNYDFAYHLGDRLTLQSDGGFDFFYQGMKTWSVGASLNKPPRVNLYLGLRTFSGPFTYNTVTLTESYQLSPKWLATASTTFALANKGNIGENFTFTRVGEAFITSLAVYVDGGKNNNGFNLMISPRFLGQQMMRTMGASGVPMAGMYGLE